MITLEKALEMVDTIRVRCTVNRHEAIDVDDVKEITEEIFENLNKG